MKIINHVTLPLLMLFSTAGFANEPIKFGPGPVIPDAQFNDTFNNIPFVTARIVNGNREYAEHLDSFISQSDRYANTLFVGQYIDSQLYLPGQWLEQPLGEGDQWLIVSNNERINQNDTFVDSFADRIIKCLHSMDQFSFTFNSLLFLLQGQDHEEPQNVDNAIQGARELMTVANSDAGCQGNINQVNVNRETLRHGIKINLTGEGLPGVFIGARAIEQQAKVFQEIFYGNNGSATGWYVNEKLDTLIDFVGKYTGTLVDKDLDVQLKNSDNYSSFLDMAVIARNTQSFKDDQVLEQVAKACLDGTVDSIFKKDFSLPQCIERGDLGQSYTVEFQNQTYFVYEDKRTNGNY